MDHTDFLESDVDLTKLVEGVCTETIIASGIRRFFIASNNPDPAIIGNGIRLFQNAGIEVITDLCKIEADCSNRAFIHLMKHQKTTVVFLLDNPFLTTRLPHGGKNPIRISIDRRLMTPEASCTFPNGGVS